MSESIEEPPQDDVDGSHLETPEWHLYSELALAWTLNPDRAKIRRSAKAEIKRRIEEVVEPHGFTRAESGTGWVHETWWMTRGIYLQYARGGDRCYVNLSKQRRFLSPKSSSNREVKRLGHFYEGSYNRVGEPGSLYYYDITDFPEYIDEAMDVMSDKALPWLMSWK